MQEFIPRGRWSCFLRDQEGSVECRVEQHHLDMEVDVGSTSVSYSELMLLPMGLCWSVDRNHSCITSCYREAWKDDTL
jgi:hypothetical protein